MKTFTIQVHGIPAPQGSKKFVGHAKNGRGILVESSKKVKPWREAVAAAIIEANARSPIFFEGAVRLTLDFVMPRGVSEKKVTRQHTRQPDIFKLARSTEDAITTSAIWKDDSIVIDGRCTKRTAELGEPSGCIIKIEDIAVLTVKTARGKKEPAQKQLKLIDDTAKYFV